MEHGVLHTGNHEVDPQDMFNMGGLRKKMPITFWTFLIGGFALSGFPLVTAGFWSKDEILADAFGHGHWWVFGTLAIAAFLTAFYTMRQITLTFLGEPRTAEAEHAQETSWTMTAPLVILSIFAIGYGWVGIPEHFPVLGGLVPNWIHEFVGGTLADHPEAVEFNIDSIADFICCSTWRFIFRLAYLSQCQLTCWKIDYKFPLLKNKYYFDELYDFLFVKPAYWFAETFVYKWMDKGLIDGILHIFDPITNGIGSFIRKYFDLPVINRFFGDGSATSHTGLEANCALFKRDASSNISCTGLSRSSPLALYSITSCLLKEPLMNFIDTHLLSLILFFPALAALGNAIPAEG